MENQLLVISLGTTGRMGLSVPDVIGIILSLAVIGVLITLCRKSRVQEPSAFCEPPPWMRHFLHWDTKK